MKENISALIIFNILCRDKTAIIRSNIFYHEKSKTEQKPDTFMIRICLILNNIYSLRWICIRPLYITRRNFIKITPMKLNLKKKKASWPTIIKKFQQYRTQ